MPATASSQEGKLLATPVVTQFEGAGGGGLVPFATLAGYASDEDIAVNGFATRLNVDEFDLTVKGMSFNYHDRVELSLATQKLGVDPLALDIRQQVAGIKVRLYGDIVYSAMPQVSVGLQHKKLKDKTVARAVGADKLQDTDIYLAASKLHLGVVGGYNFLWNLTTRYTGAHQTGFLGFSDDKHWQFEGSAAILLGRHIAVGAEYRTKPDELAFASEEDWQDVFVAWFPNKHVNLTAAWVKLGDVAGQTDQSGLYVSTTFYFQ